MYLFWEAENGGGTAIQTFHQRCHYLSIFVKVAARGQKTETIT